MSAERENLRWPLVIALAIHGLAGLTLRAGSSPDALRVQRTEPSSELDVTLEPRAESPLAPSMPASSELAVRAAGRELDRHASRLAAAVESEAPAPALEPITPVEPAPVRPAPLGPERLGIAGSNPLLRRPKTPGASAPRSPSVAPGVERSIANELARNDARVGFGPQGPIIGELERLTQSAAMPDNTSALFVAAIDGSGRLTELSVLEATASFGAWNDVAERAKRSLRKKKLAAGARGMKLRIQVSSRIQLPSGADPGLEVSVLGIPLKRGAGKRSSRLALLEPIFKLEMIDVPDPGGSGNTIKLPSATISIVPFSGAGDLADVGASPRRLVHAHVVDQDVL